MCCYWLYFDQQCESAGRQASVALIEEGAEQEDDTDVLIVTEALPSTARSTAQDTSGQGALVRNILEAEKTLQACLLIICYNVFHGLFLPVFSLADKP